MKANAAAQKIERPAERPPSLHTIPALAEGPMKRCYTNWKAMDADQLVEEGNRQIMERGVPSKSRLKDMISGLFRAINRREDAEQIWPRIRFCHTESQVKTEKPKKPRRKVPEEPKSDVKAIEAPLSEPIVSDELVPPTQRYGSWGCKASDTIVGIANTYIKKADIGSMKELKATDRPLWAVIRKRGIQGMLEFVEKEKTREPRPEKPRSSAPPKERQCPNTDKMYEYILHHCFRMGTGRAYIGHYRATLQQLRPDGLSREEWKVFKRCWKAMVRAGIIVHNSTETAASLDIKRNSIEDPVIKKAVVDAIERESRIKTCR